MTYPVVDRRARRRGAMYGGGFLPSHLFLAGEEGVWYDPSDLATLFQDSAGTTPVTADGDPVGLMLDKSEGLVLGPELVTNGTFDTDLSGWSTLLGAGSSVTHDNGGARIQSPSGASSDLVQNVGAGQYEINYEITSSLSGQIRLAEANNATAGGFGNIIFPLPSSVGTHKVIATLTKPFIYFGRVGVCDITIDNISVKALPGNHATQTTSAARPVLDEPPEWFINFDAVDDKHTSTLPNLGTDVTIARASPGVGAVILTGQTIGAGPYDYSTDHAGLIIVNRALTASETASLTAYLNKKAGV